MLKSTFLYRVGSSSKILKFNAFLVVALMIAASMAVSFAADGDDVTPAPTAEAVCGARVVLVIDRSASIGVDNLTGSRANSNANIAAVKTAGSAFVDALRGPDSYMDLFAFGTLTKRINGAPSWFRIDTPANANLQKYAIQTTTFKTGASMDDHNQFQDGLDAHSEAFTNWESALKTVNQTRVSNSTDPSQRATHIVMFTDGNPTVTVEAAEAAVANNGSFPANLSPALSTPEIYQLARERAFGAAGRIRDKGVKIIPVAVGQNISQANLQNIAGAGNPTFRANNFAGLTDMFEQVAEEICPTNDGIEITKTVDPTTAKPGDTVTYSFVVKNTGETKLRNVKVTDPLLGGQVGATIDLIEPGASAPVITQTFVIPDDATGTIHNVATATGTPFKGGIARPDVTDDDDADVIVTPSTDDGIEITKTVDPTTAKPGDTVTYSFVVKNTGETKLTNVKVTDPMLGGQVGTTIAELDPGQSAPVITKTFVIPANATGVVHNVATVTGTPVDDDNEARPDVTDDDDADVTISTVVPPSASSVAVEKTVQASSGSTTFGETGTFSAGQPVTFKIKVTNTGDTRLKNVKVVDANATECSKGGEDTSILIPDQVSEYTCIHTAGYTANTTNTAIVTGQPLDANGAPAGNPVTATDTAQVNVTAVPPSASSVSVEKTVQASSGSTTFGETGTFSAGQPVTFKIKVTNTGDTRLKNVKVVDANATECSKGGEDTSILIPDQVSEYTCIHTAGYTANTTNTAIVTGQPLDANGAPVGTPVSATDTAQVNVTAVPSITIDKTADQTTAAVGSTVNYTFVVTNTSTVTLSNITVTDNVIGDIGTIATLAPGASFTKTVAFVVPASAVGTLRNIATACFAVPVANPNCASDDHSLIVTTVAVGGESVTRTSAGGDSLPFTGSQTVWLATVAGLILALGGVMFALSRKRKENNAY